MKQLPTQYQNFIYKSHYARYLHEQQRREDWQESIARYFDFFEAHLESECGYKVSASIRSWLQTATQELQAVMAMRCLATAGAALESNNIAGFNCTYLLVDSIYAFSELCYLLMHGCGVGFSVERQYINKLPVIPSTFSSTQTTIFVMDSKEGWATAIHELITLLYQGKIPRWDTRQVRPAGMPLKTFGGRASGPEPLVAVFEQIIRIFTTAAGRRLNSLECHNILCHISSCIQVGGKRRSACISLSNLSDERMARCKSGQWWDNDSQLAFANNSVAFTEIPSMERFMLDYFMPMYQSKAGERGIFNRIGNIESIKHSRRYDRLRDAGLEGELEHLGTNPCGEILLLPNECCNLTEIIARADDTEEMLHEKARIAATLGTWQTTLTRVKGLRPEWNRNLELERLLGVSITGIMDCPLLNGVDGDFDGLKTRLNALRDTVIQTNKEVAKELGILESVATTCIKPSGTVSQLANCSPGIHARLYPIYLRRVKMIKGEPLCEFMMQKGMSHREVHGAIYFDFPERAPQGCITESDLNAIQQLDLWKMYKQNWCDGHNPSVTIKVAEDEWLDVAAYLYRNFSMIGGLTLWPRSDVSPSLLPILPFYEITESEYNEALKQVPQIDFSEFRESQDNTTGTREYACAGEGCEV